MFGAIKTQKNASGSTATATPGSAAVVGGSVTVVIPPGVTSISAICLGGGGGGGRGSSSALRGGGGGGGAMCWSNDIAVTPGETLTLVGGTGGTAGVTGVSGGPGGDSTVQRGATVLVRAKGGLGGQNDNGTAGRTGGQASACTYNGGAFSGGDGGSPTSTRNGGGGGAGGYGGAGGSGGGGTTTTESYGAAGGGDGAGGGASAGTTAINAGFGGGGSNMYGTGGSTGTQVTTAGTNGVPGGRTGPSINTNDTNNRLWGAGGGGSSGGSAPSAGGIGFARIIFGPGVSAPSTLCGAYPWTFVTSVTSTNISTITMPSASAFQPGDIAVLIEGATGSTAPGVVVPTGFDSTTQYSATVGTSRVTTSQKVLRASDADTVITGMSGNLKSRKTLLIFRQQQGCSIALTGIASATNTISGGIVASPAVPTAPQTNQQLNGRFLQFAVGYTSGATAITAASLTFAPAGSTVTSYLHPNNGLVIKVAITPIATLVTQDAASFNSAQAANNIVMVRTTLGR